MHNFEAKVDAYILGSVEQGEDEVVESCEWCSSQLYRWEEVLKDTDGNYFCDDFCAKAFYGVKEVIL